MFAVLLMGIGIGTAVKAESPAKDFKPVIEKITVDGNLFYADGQKTVQKLTCKADQPLVIKYFFKNTGKEASSTDGSIFVHFCDEKNKIVKGGDFRPSISTSKWGNNFSGSFERKMDMKSLKGQTVKVYLGMFFMKEHGARLAMKGCAADKRVFVGSLSFE